MVRENCDNRFATKYHFRRRRLPLLTMNYITTTTTTATKPPTNPPTYNIFNYLPNTPLKKPIDLIKPGKIGVLPTLLTMGMLAYIYNTISWLVTDLPMDPPPDWPNIVGRFFIIHTTPPNQLSQPSMIYNLLPYLFVRGVVLCVSASQPAGRPSGQSRCRPPRRLGVRPGPAWPGLAWSGWSFCVRMYVCVCKSFPL